MLNLCGIVAAILKMATGRNFSMSGINLGHHYQPTYQILDDIGKMLNFYHRESLWQPFLKMATARNFSMSGINSGHHNLSTYEMSLKSDNVEMWWPF